MIYVTKRVKWAMSHRLGRGYSGSCTNLHGHEYYADIKVGAKMLNQQGMVVDFKLLKDVIGSFLDFIDHAMMDSEDTQLKKVLETIGSKTKTVPFNPTAENMAQWMLDELNAGLVEFGRLYDFSLEPREVKVVSVKIYETATSWAEAVTDDK